MLSISQAFTAYLVFVAFVFGLVFGSFCNAWAWRLAHGEAITRGRSHCAICGHTLSAVDLIPLFSYICLKGRCRYCGAPISKRYPFAELISGVFFLSVLLRFDIAQPLVTLRWLLVGCLLLTLALVDLDAFTIPDRLLVGLVLAFAVLVPLTEGIKGVKSGLIGALAVSVPLLIFVLIADKVMGRETMGGGDIKLVAALGLHFGAAQMLLLLICACLLGIVLAVLLQKRTKKETDKTHIIPFGPALAAAAWLVMLFGERFLFWYLGLFF